MPTTRYEIDRGLYEAVPHGGYSRLAEHRNIKLKNVSKYYDPHETTYQSVFSRSLLELQVIAAVCPAWARNILKVFNGFGSQWLGSDVGQVEINTGLESIVTLAAKLQNPDTPESDRLPMALELQRQVGAVVDGLHFGDRENSGDARLRQVS